MSRWGRIGHGPTEARTVTTCCQAHRQTGRTPPGCHLELMPGCRLVRSLCNVETARASCCGGRAKSVVGWSYGSTIHGLCGRWAKEASSLPYEFKTA